MTKAEIVQALYTRVGGFSKKESADIVDMVFEMMKETLGRGEKIKISGFGNFVLRDKRQRPGRNPQTGDPIKISERRVLTFKASQILKQALNPRNGNGAHEEQEHEEHEEQEQEHEDEDDSEMASESAPSSPSPASAPAAPGMVPGQAPATTASEAPKE
jgi:integration host factor subunit alpha